MGKIISITTPKGGEGKTTTAVNLAVAFAQKGKRTLLIDLDPSGQCAPTLGIKLSQITGDLFDVFTFNKAFKSVIHKTFENNLDFVPMRQLDYASEVKLSKITSDELIHIVMGTFRLQMFKWRVANFQFDINRNGDNMIQAVLTLIKSK